MGFIQEEIIMQTKFLSSTRETAEFFHAHKR